MRTIPLILTVVATLALSGCNAQQDTESSDSKPPVPLHIEAPGIDVEVGGGEGVQVNAPGTDVELRKEKE
jgi:hypothetical protein